MDERENITADNPKLNAAGIIIGVIGCIIITASSVYTALKMGALPWPTIFTSVTALLLLRAFGRTSLNEANVTQIIMSAGSMVAGGLAFTIPGIWMLGLADKVSWVEMLFVALAGALLGLVCTALIRRRMVEESDLEYPIGIAAAETLKASEAGGTTGKQLVGSMAFAAIWTALRDFFGFIPQMIAELPITGVAFGIYCSPMMVSLGFLVGGTAVLWWFAGAMLANFGIIVGGTALEFFDVTIATQIVQSLGMGLMMGSGLGVVVKDILPQIFTYIRRNTDSDPDNDITLLVLPLREIGFLALFVAAAALLICFALGLGPIATIVIVLLSFVTTIMSAQSVGQTGIDPMEIFGLIVLLAIAALGESDQVKLFYVAGVIAVACGLGGDVMSDFKTGKIIGTDPHNMWIGQAIGALIGVVVSVATMVTLATAYGVDAFGPGQQFVSAQASVVATMVSGIPNVNAFTIGLVAGIVLYCMGIPSMMLGLGVYLPFYMSFTAALGALAKFFYDRYHTSKDDAELSHEDAGVVVASGLLGGESIVGVILALIAVFTGLIG